MRLWFILAAMLGPRFFRRFIFFFAIGAGLLIYSLLRS